MGKASTRLDKLEALRGFAATYVMIGHAAPMCFKLSGWATIPFRFGNEAVMLFFVLSGFVIRYSTPPRTHTFRAYFVKRLRRIYPLFLISLAAAYLLASWADGKWLELHGTQLLGNMLMPQDAKLSDPGTWFPAFINPALWSLSYEWWFYMLYFPLSEWRASEERKSWLVFGISAIAAIVFQVWPNPLCMYLAFLSIWWAGGQLAAEYGEHGTVTFGRQKGQLARLAILAALWAIPVARSDWSTLAPGPYPIWPLRSHVWVLAMLTLGLAWKRVGFPGFRWTFGPFALLAPISYAIYIFHYPIADWISYSWMKSPAALFLAAFGVLTFSWSYLMEVVLQSWINRATRGWLGPGRPGELGAATGRAGAKSTA